MCREAPDTLTHLLVMCQHTDIQHARRELYKELSHLADLMTFEDAEVSRILRLETGMKIPLGTFYTTVPTVEPGLG